jgi:hypothetical protein
LVRETRATLSGRGVDTKLLIQALQTGVPLEDPECVPSVASYALALWALRGKKSGDGYGFPFDRPLLDFAVRLLTLDRRVPEVVDRLVTEGRRNHRPLTKLTKIVTDVVQYQELRHAVEELNWRCQVLIACAKPCASPRLVATRA